MFSFGKWDEVGEGHYCSAPRRVLDSPGVPPRASCLVTLKEAALATGHRKGMTSELQKPLHPRSGLPTSWEDSSQQLKAFEIGIGLHLDTGPQKMTPPWHTKVVYITMHLFPPVGSPGFWDFSTSAIINSNAFDTFSLYRALASVQAHLNSSANALPSSGCTCLCSGLRSLLFPTITSGTHSVP